LSYKSNFTLAKYPQIFCQMISNFLYLSTALLGFCSIAVLLTRFRESRRVSFYFLFFLFLSNLRLLGHGLIDFIPIPINIKLFDTLFLLLSWPLLYLFILEITGTKSRINKYDFLHFILPFVIFCLTYSNINWTPETYEIGGKILIILAILYNIVYTIVAYKVMNENLWKKTVDLTKISLHTKVNRKLVIYIYIIIVLMEIRFLYNIATNFHANWYSKINNFLWVGALINLVLYLKLIFFPDYFYDYEYYKKKNKKYEKQAISVDKTWIFEVPKEINNVQDAFLKEKIEPNLEQYILRIENLAINTDCFITENFTTTNFADEMAIPKSYLRYIFKYHCSVSFNDYRKIIRVQKAKLLIKEGYLKKNTMESLASHTGFSSYSAFFKNFKSVTGFSPQEYVRK
jgi:AraC-like DNA-binding protein